eukprot:s4518_g7.t1
MIAIRGAKAQGEDDEEHVEHAELFHVALVMMLAMFGLISAIQRIVPILLRWLRRRDRQPEEEPTQEDETPRARGAPTRQAESLRTPESIRRRRRSEIREDEETEEEEADPGVPFPHGDDRGNEILRNWVPGPKMPPGPLANAAPADQPASSSGASSSQAPANLLIPPPPPTEPGAEPPRLVEEFLGSVMQEPTEHPEDWDEETHGPIGPGKGEPPAAYFQRMAEKGGHKGQDQAPEKGAKKGKKGKIPEEDEAPAKGVQKGPKGQDQAPEKGAKKGKGEEVPVKGAPKGKKGAAQEGEDGVGAPPSVPRDEDGIELPVYITPWGTRYHTIATCPTLANSGSLRRSPWCQICCRGLQLTGQTLLYSDGPGRTAHHDRNCADAPRRAFSMCQRCQEYDQRF